jgi:dienelactone hydrolase
MTRLLVLSVAVVVAVTSVSAGLARESDPQHFGCPGKDIAFKAADGTRLVAQRYGTGRTFVVLAHQADGSLCQWADYAKRLGSLGYSSLAFDFRGNGESQLRQGPAKERIERDVPAAVRLARRLGARKVLVIGASMGGWATLVSAPKIAPPLAGVVSLSAVPQWGNQDATIAVQTLTIPVLYLASQDEGLSKETQALYDATAATDKTIRIVPGSAHGIDLLSPTLGKPSWRTVRTLIETFLRNH